MTDAVVTFIDFLITVFDFFIPSYDLSADTYLKIEDSLGVVINFLMDVNFIIPLSDIITILLLRIAIKLFYFILFVGNWAVNKITDIVPL